MKDMDTMVGLAAIAGAGVLMWYIMKKKDEEEGDNVKVFFTDHTWMVYTTAGYMEIYETMQEFIADVEYTTEPAGTTGTW